MATKNTEPVDVELCSCFQTVIGSLLYLMLGTRPDIAFAVTHLSCHAVNPSQDHLNKVLYICRYLIGTSMYSLIYNGGSGVRLSEGRGQNNQQPTPNDNNKRVVVFLCGSGI